MAFNVSSILTSAVLSAAFPFNPGFDIHAVANKSIYLPSHSWEYGAETVALLELYNPALSVYGPAPFPVPLLPVDSVFAMRKGVDWIVLGEGEDGLSEGDGATGDPASLGVIAWLIGKTQKEYAVGAQEEVSYLTETAPRWLEGAGAGAISQRADVPELWADFVYMAPPFLAYYAADTWNETLLLESYKQCEYYRAVLKNDAYADEPYYGVWHHIIGPQSQELGLWSTGNAWAAAGMARVLATIMRAPVAYGASWKDQAVSDLTSWIKEIVDGVIGSGLENGMVLNYMDTDGSIVEGRIYPELSGSTLIASVCYRMALLQPQAFGNSYIEWAEIIRGTLAGTDPAGYPHVSKDGIIAPTVDPLNWFSTEPYTAGSPEGNAFVVMMYAAWRDCILAGKCHYSGGHGGQDGEYSGQGSRRHLVRSHSH